MNNTIALHEWHVALAKSELRVANVLKSGNGKAMTNLNKATAALRHAVNGTKPKPVYEPDYEIEINGIPCGVVVTYYSGPEFNNWGHPDNREPDWPAEIEFFVVDKDGYSAGWLERLADYDELYQQVMKLHKANKESIDV